MAGLGEFIVNIGSKFDTEGFKKAAKGIENIGASVRKIGIGMSVAGAAIVGSSVAVVNSWAKAGDEVEKMSRRIGFSTEALSELKHAAELSGTSLAAIEAGTRRMSRTIIDAGDGLSTATRALGRLNLTAEELLRLSPEEQFAKLTEAVAELEDPTIRAAVAQEIFGRGGMQLLPMLTDGAEGLKEMRQEAHDLGIVFSEEAAKKAAKFQDDMLRLKRSIDATKFGIAEGLLPVLEGWIIKGKEIILRVSTWIKENRELFGTIAKITLTIGGLLVVLGPILIIFGQLAMSIGAITGAIKIATVITAKFFAVISAHPFVAIAVAIAGVTLALMKYMERTAEANWKTAEAGKTTQSLINIQKKEMEALKKLATDSKITQAEREKALRKYHLVSRNVTRLENELEKDKTKVQKKESKKRVTDRKDEAAKKIETLQEQIAEETAIMIDRDEQQKGMISERQIFEQDMAAMDDAREEERETTKWGKFLEGWQSRLDTAVEFTNQLGETADSFLNLRTVQIQNETNESLNAEQKKYQDRLDWINASITDEDKKARAIEELEQGHAAAVNNIKETGMARERRAKQAMKPFMVAEAIANTAMGATKALSQGGFLFGIIMAAMVTAAGIAKVALIRAQKFARGGMAMGDLVGVLEKREVALPLEHPNTIKALSGALQMAMAGGGAGGGNIYVTVPPIGTRQEAKRMGRILGDAIFSKVKKTRRI